MNKLTTNNILEIAQQMADEKLDQEKRRVAERISCELSDVKKAVELVRSGLCYKKEDAYGIKHYSFATEEMLLNDYLSEPKSAYTEKGIRFNNDQRN